VPYTELSCHGEDVAVKMNIHANRSTACVRLEKRDAGMHSRLAARTWMPCSRSTAVRDDSLAPTWAAGMVGEDFLPGSMPHLRLDIVCVAVYLAYHSLTVDHASSQVKPQYQGSFYEGRRFVTTEETILRSLRSMVPYQRCRTRVQVVEVSHLHRSTDGAINPRSNQGLCASCTSQGC
jgi:hypothetical protein